METETASHKKAVDKKYYGVSGAVMETIRTIGQMPSQGMITHLFALITAHESITPLYYPAVLHSTQIIFVISAVFCFAGIFASFYTIVGEVNRKYRLINRPAFPVVVSSSPGYK